MMQDDAAIRAIARRVSDAIMGEPSRHVLLALAIVLSYALTRVRKDRREAVTEAVLGVILGLHNLDLPDFEPPEEPLQ